MELGKTISTDLKFLEKEDTGSTLEQSLSLYCIRFCFGPKPHGKLDFLLTK